MNISIIPMTLSLCNDFFKGFKTDPALFERYDDTCEYVYSYSKAEAYYEKLMNSNDKIEFAIICDGLVAGSIKLKHIDEEKRTCELGIHLTNDSFKGKGIGSREECLALEYAFNTMEMQTVFAKTLKKNTRSQHVLEKNGFRYIYERDGYKYYCAER